MTRYTQVLDFVTVKRISDSSLTYIVDVSASDNVEDKSTIFNNDSETETFKK